MNFFDKGEKYYFSSIEQIRIKAVSWMKNKNILNEHRQLTLRIVR